MSASTIGERIDGSGKGQGEVSLLRQLWDVLRPGDVLLTDRLMANWLNILLLQQRGIELVGRLKRPIAGRTSGAGNGSTITITSSAGSSRPPFGRWIGTHTKRCRS